MTEADTELLEDLLNDLLVELKQAGAPLSVRWRVLDCSTAIAYLKETNHAH